MMAPKHNSTRVMRGHAALLAVAAIFLLSSCLLSKEHDGTKQSEDTGMIETNMPNPNESKPNTGGSGADNGTNGSNGENNGDNPNNNRSGSDAGTISMDLDAGMDELDTDPPQIDADMSEDSGDVDSNADLDASKIEFADD